jgi:hypothetical protein
MEAAFGKLAAEYLNHILILNVLYYLAVTCVVFKLTWIIRQVSTMKPWQRWPTVISAGTLAFILLAKAFLRFGGGDSAHPLDIARELAMCAFLVSAIVLLHGKTRKY